MGRFQTSIVYVKSTQKIIHYKDLCGMGKPAVET